MKSAMLILLVVLGISLISGCGGSKTLTPDEYNRLSPQERVAYLEKKIEDNPEDLELKKTLYRELLDMNMSERAIPVMQTILKQDPYQAEIQYDYGALMMEKGENQLAYQAFRDALQSPGGSFYSSQIATHLGGRYLVQQITSSSADEAFPCFSPDGNKILFQTNQNGNWDIAELDLQSSQINIIINSEADEELPAYSPDATKIIYTSNVNDKRPIDRKFKVREIYLKELGTNVNKNLTESVADDWLPRFNTSGSKIIFVSERSDLRSIPYTEKQSDIYTMENDGAFISQLTESEFNEGGASFGPENKIYFHSNKNGSYDIFVMNEDGSLPMTVLGDPLENEVNPALSPNGTHLVYFSDKDGNYDVYLANLDGSEIERLTFHPAKDINPTFSHDGNSIAFNSDRNGNHDIFLLNLEMVSEPSSDELLSRLNELINM